MFGSCRRSVGFAIRRPRISAFAMRQKTKADGLRLRTNAGHRLLDDATAVMGHGDTHLTRYQEIYSINIWWYQ